MNEDYDNTNNEARSADECGSAGTLDVLITRLADGDADENDWLEFQRLASADHQPWQRLAEEQWLVRRLREGFERVVAKAVSVELPSHAHADSQGDGSLAIAQHHDDVPKRRFTSYSGWAVAAMLMLGWVLTLTFALPNRASSNIASQGRPIPQADDEGANLGNGPSAVPMGTLVSNAQPEELLSHYLNAPHIVRELDPVPLQMRRTTQGQEVTYMRRIIERRSVSGVYQTFVDENGNRQIQPRALTARQPEEIY